ncbi:MAG: peptidylprolyl isomerase [Verrucomicrobiales bacterium]|nr:peptidylprolyl isomerase [Verrucomicrobiales bacterium]
MNTLTQPRLLHGAFLALLLALTVVHRAGAASSKVELTIQWHGSQHPVVIELDESAAPKTCANFKKLAALGFYNGVAFHRVIPNYIVQTGDPLTKDAKRRADWGTGGPGYVIPAEIRKPHVRGAVATARISDQSNPSRSSSGSQFYFALTDIPALNDSYTVFGKVVSGLQVLDDMALLAVDANSNPLDRVEIVSAKVISDSGAKLPDPASVAQAPPDVAEAAPAEDTPKFMQRKTEPDAEPAPATVASADSPDPVPPASDKPDGGFLPFFKKRTPSAELPRIAEPASPAMAGEPKPEASSKPPAPAPRAPAAQSPGNQPAPTEVLSGGNSLFGSAPGATTPTAAPKPAGPNPGAPATEPAEPPVKKGPLNRFMKRFW